MTQATERLFARLELERQGAAYSDAARPYVTIGALKKHIEILAKRFPEVEVYISNHEDFMDRNR